MRDIYEEFVHLGRLALLGKRSDAGSLLRRDLRLVAEARPELEERLRLLLAQSAGAASILRAAETGPIPADSESRRELLREERPELSHDPTWPPPVDAELQRIVAERRVLAQLVDRGIEPTCKVLFVGPPGVGKTLAAQWIAGKLGLPLMTLDLASVMSTFLGRTGNNLRSVFDYAQSTRCVLLLDELDAVAKRRGDEAEVGELKRLVTVLIQAFDAWEAPGFLIAATNHPNLLDAAIGRRFDRIVEFPLPTPRELEQTAMKLLRDDHHDTIDIVTDLSYVDAGWSYSDLTRFINNVRRDSVIYHQDVRTLVERHVEERLRSLNRTDRLRVALHMLESGLSQRHVAQVTGVSRDTLRRHHGMPEKTGEAHGGTIQ